jgi:hypothetical protein
MMAMSSASWSMKALSLSQSIGLWRDIKDSLSEYISMEHPEDCASNQLHSGANGHKGKGKGGKCQGEIGLKSGGLFDMCHVD